ncbi:hypothetical protein GQ457_05G014770 [Hibiscus cannabinus]
MTKTTAATIVNPEDSKEDETTPKGWEEHRAKMEDRMTNMETKLNETVSNPVSEKKDTSQVNIDRTTKIEGKRPVHVTVIDDREKYSYKTDEPGILPAKPDKSLRFNIQMGENSSGIENLKQEKDNHVSQLGGPGNFMTRPKIELPFFEAQNPRGGNCFDVLKWECINVVRWFNKLVQKSSVEDYQEKFEELEPLMLQQNTQLSEGYFVSSFISGLKEELKYKVKVSEPRSVFDAARQAKLYELTMEIEAKKQKCPQKDYLHQPRFNPRHQCKVKQLNSMEEEEDQGEETHQEERLVETEDQVEGDNLEISMNALTGNTWYSTLRIQGVVKGKPVNILIDSGSTHNFIIPRWAKEGLEVVQTNPLTITVAKWEKFYSTTMSKLLSWKMQGYNFEHDFRVLQMGGSDMVLGVDWMKKYNPIVMDFKEITLNFQHEGNSIVLQGGQKSQKIKLISEEKLQKLTKKNPEWIGEFFLMNAECSETIVPQVLQPLLEGYKEVFEEPKGMPPPRNQDHAIILKPKAQPVNLRPYRFPHHQKSEIERQIKEMLSASIIQSSQSPFASPCLLVKKKDGTWRLCVDYRKLNSMIVKNKFPIPVVEDLLDEFAGARYFSKNLLQRVEYLGYIIPAHGVSTDQSKVVAMKGLAGYYRKFIKGFGEISRPLTQMLKKGNFVWTHEANIAFEE